jgi:8-oxo-dGTP diphosphatase
VVFSLRAADLTVLLIRRKKDPFAGAWALPGGFVDAGETLMAANLRELKEETGLSRIKFEQLGAFGDPGRDPRGHTVSVAFMTFMATERMPRAGDDAQDVAWFPMTQLPGVLGRKPSALAAGALPTGAKRGKTKRAVEAINLAFDHAKILREAYERMATHLRHPALPRPFSFVPELFTLEQIGQVYEAVLGPELGRHTFEEAVVRADLLVPVVPKSPAEKRAAAKRGESELYRWNKS